MYFFGKAGLRNLAEEIKARFYIKPDGGIPQADLDAAVQAALAKALTALQTAPVTSVAGRTGAVTLAKADVGLGSVLNYGLATQAEAEAGTSAVKYMTPLQTAQAIAAQGGGFAMDLLWTNSNNLTSWPGGTVATLNSPLDPTIYPWYCIQMDTNFVGKCPIEWVPNTGLVNVNVIGYSLGAERYASRPFNLTVGNVGVSFGACSGYSQSFGIWSSGHDDLFIPYKIWGVKA